MVRIIMVKMRDLSHPTCDTIEKANELNALSNEHHLSSTLRYRFILDKKKYFRMTFAVIDGTSIFRFNLKRS